MDPQKFNENDYYHIYNHGIGNDLLFKYKNDYEYFLIKMVRFIKPFCDIYAYCLLPNHFHILFKVTNRFVNGKTIEHSIKDFFNSYARSFNSVHKRKGKLFYQSYKSKIIDSENYLKWIILYIHRNPVHHKLVNNYENWEYSSYNQIINDHNRNISNNIYELFGSKEEFMDYLRDITMNYIKENEITFNYK
jgi:REP element-mobilizing transposase RayT